MTYKKLKPFGIAAFLICSLLKGAHSQTEYGVTISFTPNYSQSQSSESVIVVGFVPEYQPPAQIVDLVAKNVSTGTIILEWTSAGDNGVVGNIYAGKYSLQYSQTDTFTNFTEIAWSTSIASGNIESKDISGLNANTTYYFRLKTADLNGNWANWSPVAVAHTLCSVTSEYLSLIYQNATLNGGATNVYLTVVDTTTPSVGMAISSAAEAGFGTFGAIYDIKPDGVVFAPAAKARFSYPEPLPPGVSDESSLNVYKYKSGAWQVVHKLRQNTTENWIEVEIDSLCVFAILYPDMEAPLTKLLVSGTLGQNDWHISPVVLSLVSADDVSGVAQVEYQLDDAPYAVYSASLSVSAEGSHLIRFRATDKAGNTETEKSAVFKIDTTTPSLSYLLEPVRNTSGWNNTAVTVVFSGTDSVSGLAFCEPPKLLTSEGYGQLVAGYCLDNAGNSSTTTLTVDIDKTPPDLSYSAAPTADVQGWNNTAIVLKFICSDALSGVKSCPADIVVSEEGIEVSTSVVSVDKADNSGMAMVSGLKIDMTAPVSLVTLSGVLANGWYSSDVQIAIAADDLTSGIKRIMFTADEGPETEYSGSVSISSEGRHTFKYYAEDIAGNKEATKELVFAIDKSAPEIGSRLEPLPNDAGWSKGSIRVVFVGTDTLSGVTGCTSSVVDAEGKGQKIPGSCRDMAGNVSYSTATVSIDLVPPAVLVSKSPAPNAAGWNNVPVFVGFVGEDALSGIDSCSPGEAFQGEGYAQVGFGYCRDFAGWISTAAFTVNIDTTPPVVSYILEPAPNATGWNNAPATVFFHGTDSLSGLAWCSSSTVPTEGKGQAISGWCRDVAGNITSATATVSLDLTAPSVIIASPTVGGVFVAGKDVVTISFAVADTLDNAAASTAALVQVLDKGQPLGSGSARVSVHSGDVLNPMVLDDGVWRLEVTATDAAGNSTQAVSGVFEVIHDPLAPVTTLTIGEPKFNNGTIFISSVTQLMLSATDDMRVAGDRLGSGVAATYLALDGGAPSIVGGAVFISSEGAHTLAWHSADNAGNAEAAKTITLNVDFTPPVSEVVFSSATGGVLPAGAYVGFAALDAGSGVAEVRYSVDGSSEAIFVSTFTLPAGQHSLAWHALDNIGNVEAAHSVVVQVAGGSTGTVREVTLSFEPSVINLKSEGRYVEARLTVSSAVGGGFDEETIRITKINGTALARPLYALDDDGRGGCAKGWGRDKDNSKCYKKPKVFCSMVKFDRKALAAVLSVNAVSVVTVEGSFDDDTTFTAEDYLRVINPGRIRKGHGGRWKHPGRAYVDIGARALREDTDIDVMDLFERQADRLERDKKAQGKGFVRRGEPFEFGPDGTVFDEPVEISLPYESYDPKKERLQVAYWNPSSKDWEPLTSTIDATEKVVKAKVGHFSLYQVVVSTAVGGRVFRAAGEQSGVSVQEVGHSADFTLGEVYVYPNPAKGGKVPVFHVEVGIADSIKLKIYTVAGQLVHEHTVTGIPPVIGSVYAYEYAWGGRIASGVYYYTIEAERTGGKLKAKGRFAVIR